MGSGHTGAATLMFLLAGALTGPGSAAVAAPRPPAKLDAHLVQALARPEEPVSVWVRFVDKGERDAEDLARRLAAADAALAPRVRARRLRAHVSPLVDALDLPVHAPYLADLASRGIAVRGMSRWLNQAAVRVPAGRLSEIAGLPWVARVEPVLRMRVVRDDPEPDQAALRIPAPSLAAAAHAHDYGSTLAQLDQIAIPAVHDSGYIGTGVLVAVFDTDFTWYDTHEALRDRVIAPGHARDFVDADTVVTDPLDPWPKHGTQTFGLLAGDKPGTYLGSAFGADFALARTEYFPTEKPVEMMNWAMAAEWADSLGADVISSSVGYTTFADSAGSDYTYADMNGHTTLISRAAEIAASKGILVVNAQGNAVSGWRWLFAPADVDGDSLIAVGAVNPAGGIASFSCYGPSADGRIKPDLVARGTSVSIVTTGGDHVTGYSASGSGTSYACPILAGLAACLLQARPTWTPTMVARALRETASRWGNPDNVYGYGLPNGLDALRWTPDSTVVRVGPRALGVSLIGPNPLRADGSPARVRLALGTQARPGDVRLRVIDAQGRLVKTVWSGPLGSGRSIIRTWDGRDRDGDRVRSGVYWLVGDGDAGTAAARVVALR